MQNNRTILFLALCLQWQLVLMPFGILATLKIKSLQPAAVCSQICCLACIVLSGKEQLGVELFSQRFPGAWVLVAIFYYRVIVLPELSRVKLMLHSSGGSLVGFYFSPLSPCWTAQHGEDDVTSYGVIMSVFIAILMTFQKLRNIKIYKGRWKEEKKILLLLYQRLCGGTLWVATPIVQENIVVAIQLSWLLWAAGVSFSTFCY